MTQPKTTTSHQPPLPSTHLKPSHHPRERVHAYRLYLCSSFGTQQNGSIYDIRFDNIHIPLAAVASEKTNDDHWHIAAESFVLAKTVMSGSENPIPFIVTTDLPSVNAFSNLVDQSIPLVMLAQSEDMNSSGNVAVDSVGHRLATNPSLLFQSGSIRIRITGLDGTIPTNDETQVWAIILSIYRLGYK